MIRDCSLQDICDGRTYGVNDMVRVDTAGCHGCYRCCCNMGRSIVLDPLDFFRLREATGCTPDEIMAKYAEFNMVDGVILPNLRMVGEENACPFLNSDKRCSIHGMRPGMCRLFPLGRYYENGGYSYIIQSGECPMNNPSKIKVRKWIGVRDYDTYREFVLRWHGLIRHVGALTRTTVEESRVKELLIRVINMFYLGAEARNEEDFLTEFYEKADLIYDGNSTGDNK